MQLVSDQVQVLMTKKLLVKCKFIILKVREKWKSSGQMIEIKALMGDASDDNIPGYQR